MMPVRGARKPMRKSSARVDEAVRIPSRHAPASSANDRFMVTSPKPASVLCGSLRLHHAIAMPAPAEAVGESPTKRKPRRAGRGFAFDFKPLLRNSFAELAGREVARIDRLFEEFFLAVGPILADRRV